MDRDDNTKAKVFSFFTLSTVVHIAIAIAIAHFTYKATQKLPKVTEVEFMAPAEASAEAGLEDTVAAPTETASAPVEATEASVAPVEATTELPKAKSKPAAVVKAQVPIAETTTDEETSQTTSVADEQAPESNEPKIELKAAVPAQTSEADEDTQALETTDAAPQDEELAKMADKYSADADEQFKQAEKDLAESQLAEAKALEEQAAKDKAAAEAARLAEANQIAETTQSAGGESAQTAQAGNGTEEVRALEELKQQPGNRKPVYDISDRRAGRSGEVIFTAYVTKQGTLSDFKLVKSSGHRSLDAKTLSAIKSWKFYPNQEGRTELGFKWDLKGDAVEMPSTLRR